MASRSPTGPGVSCQKQMALEEVLWWDLDKVPNVKELRLILETASRLGSSLPRFEGLEPLVRANCESEWNLSNRSFIPLAEFFKHGGVSKSVAEAYCLVLVRANFSYQLLMNTCIEFTPDKPENKDEPPETLYGHLLSCLREINFENYPAIISDAVEQHIITIIRMVMKHFVPASFSTIPRAAGPEEELQPPGANTGTQLPRKKYIFMAVSVDAMPVKNRMAVWQVRLSIT